MAFLFRSKFWICAVLGSDQGSSSMKRVTVLLSKLVNFVSVSVSLAVIPWMACACCDCICCRKATKSLFVGSAGAGLGSFAGVIVAAG